MAKVDTIASRLLDWWDSGHKDLPWRSSRDPYVVWVSEVMLQQTQIGTVIPYFEQWMGRFPDVQTVAAASLDDVLKQWEGLGYYRRARNMLAAAQIIAVDFEGKFPESIAQLKKLPGIGPYTAGAIASIAFDCRVPVVDGNVTRVLSRLLDLEKDVTQGETKKQLWQTASELVPARRPGDYNQALMELGQEICVVREPRCHECPLRNGCLARQRGTQLERPVRPRRRKTPHFHVTAAVIWNDKGQVLITKRPQKGLLGGLWEFPGGKQEGDESLVQALRREICEELALEIEVREPILSLQHAYTHFRITLHAYHARVRRGVPINIGVDDHVWTRPTDLGKYAFAATDKKIVLALQASQSDEADLM